MIEVEVVRRLNYYDADALVRVLELNEDRLYAWLIEGSITVVREELGGAVEYVKALREMIRIERADYVSPCETVLPIYCKKTDKNN